MNPLEFVDDRPQIQGPLGHLDLGDLLDRLDIRQRVTGRADPADPLDDEGYLVERLGLVELLDAAMVVGYPHVHVHDGFAVDIELVELRLFLKRVERTDVDYCSVTHVPLLPASDSGATSGGVCFGGSGGRSATWSKSFRNG